MNCRHLHEHGKDNITVNMSNDPTLLQKPAATMPRAGRHEQPSPSANASSPISEQQAKSQTDERQSPVMQHNTRESSPRSQHSESSHTAQLVRQPRRGCRYETGMAQARRRVPYSLGPEKLASEPEIAEQTLGEEAADKLTKEMRKLYEQVLPSAESEERRRRFVQKLDKLLRSRWPGMEIKVSVFGSTGNYLGSSDSDVDICITTDCKEIENVCLIAELLAQNGMQRVVCVSSAKVPIVKAWDPELQVACDMNVNNPIALENTQMIRSYIQIDDRVRPLAMIVKYWAKRRILNDAALGGTLSSYTWICMVLNFLQTRKPAILPTLQQKDGLHPFILGGVNVAFDKDLLSYRNFGARNKSSLGDLLFQFFKYFGHELDFEGNAISVRLGKIIPKSQKAWHLLQDNRLCVEEPFNTSRNLANTADDTSMRGIHLELRRAFELLSQGDFTGCCEEYIRAPEEHKQTATFVQPTARPIIPQAPAQANNSSSTRNRNGYRSARNNNRNMAGRRASNPSHRNPNYLHDLPFQMTPQELQLQAQHQQHLLHDQLFQQYQYLQLQEQELRLQLYQQSLRQRGMASNHNYPNSVLANDGAMRLPLSPNVYQNRFGAASPFLTSPSPSNGATTNPGSPLLGHVVADHRRLPRRPSGTTPASAASTRAHSQPARSIPGSAVYSQNRPAYDMVSETETTSDRRSSLASHASTANLTYMPYAAAPSTLYDAGRRPAEFMGYYVGQSPSLAAKVQSTTISPLPSHAGLAIHNGGLSPRLSSRSSQVASGTSSPLLPGVSNGTGLVAQDTAVPSDFPPSPPLADGPLIIDGSFKSPKRRQQANRKPISNSDNYTVSTAFSEDNGIDTPATSEDQFHDGSDKLMSVANGIHTDQNIDSVLNSFHTFSMRAQQQDNGLPPQTSNRTPDKSVMSQTSTPTSMFSVIDGPLYDSTGQLASGKRRKGRIERSPIVGGPEAATTTTAPPLHNKTNGQHFLGKESTAALVTDAASAWQTQKKRKKSRKATKSEADVTALNSAGGEMLPLDESLRKGG